MRSEPQTLSYRQSLSTKSYRKLYGSFISALLTNSLLLLICLAGMFIASRDSNDEGRVFVILISIVFGSQVLVNDWFRIQVAIQLLRQEGYNEQAALSISRTIACDLLVILEMATVGWDFVNGQHFPLSWRIPLLVVCLPVMTTTSKKLWFWQNERLLENKKAEKEKI